MVEGPGCKLKGETLIKRIKGKVVVDIRFCGLSKPVGAEDHQPAHPQNENLREFIGQTVVDVRTVGKELFLFFSNRDLCIRLHFLMNGAINYGMKAEWVLKKNASECNLIIKFLNDILVVCKSSAVLRPSQESVSHCDTLQDLDICSPAFNFDRAIQLIQLHSTDIICDVVMDQGILPGVGNIIKNEGLFRAGINPNARVMDLTHGLIRSLVHRLRDFSAVFYNCRKQRKTLKDSYCIYEKTSCSECGCQVTVCKPGKLGRLTFFCPKCQCNAIGKDCLSIPKKNSLLGYLNVTPENQSKEMTVHAAADEDLWECQACTFHNKFSSSLCEMCETVSSNVQNRSRIITSNNSEGESSQDQKINHAANLSCKALVSKSDQKTLKQSSGSSLLCLNHQKPCVLLTVRRAGANKGRLFYCCSLPKGKQCDFFQWADFHHPKCDHGKTTLKRRVLKQNENNGKEFYCCSQPKNNQCGFFQWV